MKNKRNRKQSISDITKSMRRNLIPQLSIQSIAVVLTVACSFALMTWLVQDLLSVEHIYASAGFELLGVLGFLIIVLVPYNIVSYRRRAREVMTLSDAIRKVAGGDYESKIPTEKKVQITPIYEAFNKMCDELQSVQMLRYDFINSYSHEFKTPIASIKGFAELLLEKDMTKEEQQMYLQIIVDESERLSSLSRNTILLSKLSSQSIVSDQEEYDLGEQLRQSSIILSGKWLDKKIEFDCQLEDVKYVGNREMMYHLWINLLDNAVKYTPEGGEITVTLVREENEAVVRIEDTGMGMTEDVCNHLFEPYFQGDSSHSKHGLGLGLAIAKRIIELCDGSIKVDSRVGEGSVFTVQLPIAENITGA